MELGPGEVRPQPVAVNQVASSVSHFILLFSKMQMGLIWAAGKRNITD